MYIAIECQAREKSIEALGEIRLRLSDNNYLCFLKDHIAKGSTIVCTSCYRDDINFRRLFRHSLMRKKPFQIGKMLPPTYTIMKELLDMQLLGTHQLLCSREHTNYYLTECCFKYNHRNITSAQDFFDELLRNAVLSKPIHYNEII